MRSDSIGLPVVEPVVAQDAHEWHTSGVPAPLIKNKNKNLRTKTLNLSCERRLSKTSENVEKSPSTLPGRPSTGRVQRGADARRTRRTAVYALYRGDEFVDVGTADELAGRRHVTPEYVRWMACPVARRRDRGGRLLAVRTEEDR